MIILLIGFIAVLLGLVSVLYYIIGTSFWDSDDLRIGGKFGIAATLFAIIFITLVRRYGL